MKTLAVMHMLFVQDMERAISFYKNTFDFKVLDKSDFWTSIDCGHGCLGLTTYGNKTGLKETVLIIEVDDHLQAVERIKKNGGQILGISDPYEGAPVYNVKAVDTENNQITISKVIGH